MSSSFLSFQRTGSQHNMPPTLPAQRTPSGASPTGLGGTGALPVSNFSFSSRMGFSGVLNASSTPPLPPPPPRSSAVAIVHAEAPLTSHRGNHNQTIAPADESSSSSGTGPCFSSSEGRATLPTPPALSHQPSGAGISTSGGAPMSMSSGDGVEPPGGRRRTSLVRGRRRSSVCSSAAGGRNKKRSKVDIPPYLRGMARAVNDADEKQFPELVCTNKPFPPTRALRGLTTEINDDVPLSRHGFRQFRAALAEARQHLHGVEADILESNSRIAETLKLTTRIDANCTQSNIAMVKLFPRVKECHNFMIYLAKKKNLRDSDPVSDCLLHFLNTHVLKETLECIREIENFISEGKKQYIESTIGTFGSFAVRMGNMNYALNQLSAFYTSHNWQPPTNHSRSQHNSTPGTTNHHTNMPPTEELATNPSFPIRSSPPNHGDRVTPPFSASSPSGSGPPAQIRSSSGSPPIGAGALPKRGWGSYGGGMGLLAPHAAAFQRAGASTNQQLDTLANSISSFSESGDSIMGVHTTTSQHSQDTATNAFPPPSPAARLAAHRNRYSAAQILFPDALFATGSGPPIGGRNRGNSFVLAPQHLSDGTGGRRASRRRSQLHSDQLEDLEDWDAEDDDVVLKENYGMVSSDALPEDLRRRVSRVNSDLRVHLAHFKWLINARKESVYFDSHRVLEDQAMRRLWAEYVGRNCAGCFAEEFEATALLQLPEWSREPVMKILNYKNCGVISLYSVQRLLKVWGPLPMLEHSLLHDLSAGFFSLQESMHYYKETFAFGMDAAPGDYVVALSENVGEVHVILLRAVKVDPRRPSLGSNGSLMGFHRQAGSDHKPGHPIGAGGFPRALSIGGTSAQSLRDDDLDTTLCSLEAIPFRLSHDTGAWTVHSLSHEEFETISEACQAFPEIFVRPRGEVYCDGYSTSAIPQSNGFFTTAPGGGVVNSTGTNITLPTIITGTGAGRAVNTASPSSGGAIGGHSSPSATTNTTTITTIISTLSTSNAGKTQPESGFSTFKRLSSVPAPLFGGADVAGGLPAPGAAMSSPSVPMPPAMSGGRGNSCEYSALHRACFRNNELFVQGLLRRGADAIINTGVIDAAISPSFCWTPLLCAVNNQNSDPVVIVKKLLELGADPTIEDDARCTALYYAIMNRYPGAVQALLSHSPQLQTSPWTVPLLLTLGAHHFHCRDVDIRLQAEYLPQSEVVEAVAECCADYVVVRLALDVLQDKLNGVVKRDYSVAEKLAEMETQAQLEAAQREQRNRQAAEEDEYYDEEQRKARRARRALADAPTPPSHVDEGLPLCYMDVLYDAYLHELRTVEQQASLSRLIEHHGQLCREHTQEVQAALRPLYYRCYFLSVRRYMDEEAKKDAAKALLAGVERRVKDTLATTPPAPPRSSSAHRFPSMNRISTAEGGGIRRCETSPTGFGQHGRPSPPARKKGVRDSRDSPLGVGTRESVEVTSETTPESDAYESFDSEEEEENSSEDEEEQQDEEETQLFESDDMEVHETALEREGEAGAGIPEKGECDGKEPRMSSTPSTASPREATTTTAATAAAETRMEAELLHLPLLPPTRQVRSSFDDGPVAAAMPS